MNFILIIILTFVSFFSVSQINVSEIVIGDTIVKEALFEDAKINIQLNELFTTISIQSSSIISLIEEISELQIEKICKKKDVIIINSILYPELEHSESTFIKIDLESNSILIDHEDMQFIYSGKGVNITIANLRNIKRCSHNTNK
jgi:uncharacterized protein YqgV (UPF0045/DUF77 family)